MNYLIQKKAPTDEALRLHAPLLPEDQARIAEHRAEIQAILSGQDKRLLMIVGPCSAWPEAATFIFAEKLLKLNAKIQNKLKILMRVYPQKPRTLHGWTGSIHQPDPLLAPDIEAGMKSTRAMMQKIIRLGLGIASEPLFTSHYESYLEMLSWIAIGARSSEDQERRIFASSTTIPVGMKNPTHGAITVSVNSVLAAQQSHTTIINGYQVKTLGNPYAHLVLRGANQAPNYSIPHLEMLSDYLAMQHIQNPSILIDASHDNCIENGVKNYRLQGKVIVDALKIRQERPDFHSLIKGFMMESFLKDGSQQIGEAPLDQGGLSITDPCLSWDASETILLEIAEKI